MFQRLPAVYLCLRVDQKSCPGSPRREISSSLSPQKCSHRVVFLRVNEISRSGLSGSGRSVVAEPPEFVSVRPSAAISVPLYDSGAVTIATERPSAMFSIDDCVTNGLLESANSQSPAPQCTSARSSKLPPNPQAPLRS